MNVLGLRGLAIPVVEGDMGPPKLTRSVQVEKPRSNETRGGGPLTPFAEVVHAIVHELGHAVGIPHHGDTVENWRVVLGPQNIAKWLSLQQHAGGAPDFTQPNSLPAMPESTYAAVDGRQYLFSLLVEPGGDCVEGHPDASFYQNGAFAGCRADSIARRGQQNSGDFECPMRYSGSNYYEPPGVPAAYRWTGLVGWKTFGRIGDRVLVNAWGGRLLKYRNDLDRDGEGKFCSSITGTGINGPAGDSNHAGAAGRDKPCRDFIVVNDLAARGAR